MNTFLFIVLCTAVALFTGLMYAFTYAGFVNSALEERLPNPNIVVAIFGVPVIAAFAPEGIAKIMNFETWEDALSGFRGPVSDVLIAAYFVIFITVFIIGAKWTNKKSRVKNTKNESTTACDE